MKLNTQFLSLLALILVTYFIFHSINRNNNKAVLTPTVFDSNTIGGDDNLNHVATQTAAQPEKDENAVSIKNDESTRVIQLTKKRFTRLLHGYGFKEPLLSKLLKKLSDKKMAASLASKVLRENHALNPNITSNFPQAIRLAQKDVTDETTTEFGESIAKILDNLIAAEPIIRRIENFYEPKLAQYSTQLNDYQFKEVTMVLWAQAMKLTKSKYSETVLVGLDEQTKLEIISESLSELKSKLNPAQHHALTQIFAEFGLK